LIGHFEFSRFPDDVFLTTMSQTEEFVFSLPDYNLNFIVWLEFYDPAEKLFEDPLHSTAQQAPGEKVVDVQTRELGWKSARIGSCRVRVSGHNERPSYTIY
jgi:hypothetical protein